MSGNSTCDFSQLWPGTACGFGVCNNGTCECSEGWSFGEEFNFGMEDGMMRCDNKEGSIRTLYLIGMCFALFSLALTVFRLFVGVIAGRVKPVKILKATPACLCFSLFASGCGLRARGRGYFGRDTNVTALLSLALFLFITSWYFFAMKFFAYVEQTKKKLKMMTSGAEKPSLLKTISNHKHFHLYGLTPVFLFLGLCCGLRIASTTQEETVSLRILRASLILNSLGYLQLSIFVLCLLTPIIGDLKAAMLTSQNEIQLKSFKRSMGKLQGIRNLALYLTGILGGIDCISFFWPFMSRQYKYVLPFQVVLFQIFVALINLSTIKRKKKVEPDRSSASQRGSILKSRISSMSY